MKIKTSKGTEFDCEGIASIPTPPRMYLYLINTSVEEVAKVLNDELPIEGYPYFSKLQAVFAEGTSSVRVTLKGA